MLEYVSEHVGHENQAYKIVVPVVNQQKQRLQPRLMVLEKKSSPADVNALIVDARARANKAVSCESSIIDETAIKNRSGATSPLFADAKARANYSAN